MRIGPYLTYLAPIYFTCDDVDTILLITRSRFFKLVLADAYVCLVTFGLYIDMYDL